MSPGEPGPSQQLFPNWKELSSQKVDAVGSPSKETDPSLSPRSDLLLLPCLPLLKSVLGNMPESA